MSGWAWDDLKNLDFTIAEAFGFGGTEWTVVRATPTGNGLGEASVQTLGIWTGLVFNNSQAQIATSMPGSTVGKPSIDIAVGETATIVPPVTVPATPESLLMIGDTLISVADPSIRRTIIFANQVVGYVSYSLQTVAGEK